MSRSVHVSLTLKSAISEHIRDVHEKTGMRLTEGQVLDRTWKFFIEGIELQTKLGRETTASIKRIEQMVGSISRDTNTPTPQGSEL